VHVLINNAGIGYEAAFPRTSLEDWDRIVNVNLWGVIHGCHFFMPYLAKVDRAHIVNLSSLFGIVAMPGQSAYSATKFAVRGLSESLWEELRATSVGLTVVHAGAVATNIMKTARGDDPELLRRIAAWYERHAIAPERVAAQIIRAVEKGTPRLLVAPEAAFGDILRRLMPVTGNKLFVDAAIRSLGVEDMRARRIEQWRETMVEGGPGVDGRTPC
jgi:short-subunit dehydrogenase